MNGKFDIENLSYEELLELNRTIVARLKFLDASRTFMEMLDFRVGNRVQFRSSEGRLIRGTVARLNRKTVSVVTPEGQKWNVSPSLLEKVHDDPSHGSDTKVIDLE